MLDEILNEIQDIQEIKTLSNLEKRKIFNQMEKDNPQNLFIKTHLCSCGKMKVEVWIKKMDFEM